MVQPSTFPFSLNDFLLKSLGSYIQNLQFIKTTCRIPGDRPNLQATEFLARRKIPLYSDLVNQANSVNRSILYTFRSPLYYKHRPDVPGCSIGKVSSTNARKTPRSSCPPCLKPPPYNKRSHSSLQTL